MTQERFIHFNSLVNSAAKSMSRLKYKRMGSYGLGSAHTICMCVLSQKPDGVTKTELAKLCGVDKAQISRTVSFLSEKKYVSVSNPEKNYKQKYKLTDDGKNIADEMQSIIIEINNFVSGDIPKDQIESFYKTFTAICQNLEKAEEIF